jgi:hypothetical protein
VHTEPRLDCGEPRRAAVPLDVAANHEVALRVCGERLRRGIRKVSERDNAVTWKVWAMVMTIYVSNRIRTANGVEAARELRVVGDDAREVVHLFAHAHRERVARILRIRLAQHRVGHVCIRLKRGSKE